MSCGSAGLVEPGRSSAAPLLKVGQHRQARPSANPPLGMSRTNSHPMPDRPGSLPKAAWRALLVPADPCSTPPHQPQVRSAEKYRPAAAARRQLTWRGTKNLSLTQLNRRPVSGSGGRRATRKNSALSLRRCELLHREPGSASPAATIPRPPEIDKNTNRLGPLAAEIILREHTDENPERAWLTCPSTPATILPLA